MVSTLVGYTGGKKKNPTYHSLGRHSEALKVVFDPTVISYADLLREFWRAHDPCSTSFSDQYRAAVFYQNDEQKRVAEQTRDEVQAQRKSPIKTPILPAGEFWPAEDYHQKYYLKGSPELAREFQAMYPDPAKLAASTAAARVNGIMGGHATPEEVEALLPQLGLSESAGRRLLHRVRRGGWL